MLRSVYKITKPPMFNCMTFTLAWALVPMHIKSKIYNIPSQIKKWTLVYASYFVGLVNHL